MEGESALRWASLTHQERRGAWLGIIAVALLPCATYPIGAMMRASMDDVTRYGMAFLGWMLWVASVSMLHALANSAPGNGQAGKQLVIAMFSAALAGVLLGGVFLEFPGMGLAKTLLVLDTVAAVGFLVGSACLVGCLVLSPRSMLAKMLS